MARDGDDRNWPSELRDKERYKAIRQKLITYFARRGGYDVEGLVDETISRVVRKIDLWQRETVPFEAFLFGFARIVAREKGPWKQPEEQLDDSVHGVDELVDPNGAFASISQDGTLGCLRRCLQNLGKEEREMIIDYYDTDDDDEGAHKRARQALAARLGIFKPDGSANTEALSSRVLRLRPNLKQCVKDCLEKR